MQTRQQRDVVELGPQEASFMSLEIDPVHEYIRIKWFRPVSSDECARAVQIASQVAQTLNDLRNMNYSLVQE